MIVVAVDLLFLVPGVVGGSEDYTTALLRSFAAHPPDDVELRLFAQSRLLDAHPDLGEAFEVETLSLDGRNKVARVAAESAWFDRVASRHRPAMQHHFGGRVPLRASGAQIMTLHDLQPLDHPENFGLVKRRFLKRAIPRSLERADRVVTVSDSVRRQVIDRFKLPADHVVSIPSGLGPPRPPAEQIPAGVPERFLLYPAVSHPHKNHEVLLHATAMLRDRGEDTHLVFVGGEGAAAESVRASIVRLGLGDRVHHLGRVDRPVVDALLARCDAMLFPSRYEGFGLPLLEAFRMGAPVIAADVEPLRSVAGDAAVLLDPDDAGAWAQAMARPPHHDPRAAQVALDAFSPASRADLLATLYRTLASEQSDGR